MQGEQMVSDGSGASLPLQLPRGRLNSWQYLRALRDNPMFSYEAGDEERDIVVHRRLWHPVFIINSPEAIKHVMVDNADNYQRTELGRRVLEPFIGSGLLSSEGEMWRNHRRTVMPAFDRRRIMSYAKMMTEAADGLVRRWDALSDEGRVDVYDSMRDTTLEVICSAMFSAPAEEIKPLVKAGFAHARKRGQLSLTDILNFPVWLTRLSRPGRGKGMVPEFERAVEYLLESRRRAGVENAENADLLSRLLAAGGSTEAPMTERGMRDEIATILTAGHHTTALALTWTWFLLSKHPKVDAKLSDELTSVLGGRSAQYDDLDKLPYTRMVIEESMRLYPPVHSLPRRAVKDDIILGTPIPAKATVLIVPWLLHRRQSLWANPERFEPERFSAEGSKGRHRMAYLPFGGGRHICVGSTLAITEMMIFLATIRQRYRLALDPQHPVKIWGLFNLMPRNGMRMILHRSEPRGVLQTA